ncbi:MCE-family Mce1D domain protein [Mycobacterium ulcerans str. Harvey]|uniref:MCE-family Mce1D domain protein n=1 Tax=Mycobacterium ulcerans str. Harvey TaxID=1299332 RepID=A0ABP3AKU0_MYCUL|nr:MCE-family Mce1D domain protein [Mycobacterium ulcerans str. Harvey]
MQGQQVGPITAGLMTPESLSELMGGPDIEPVQSTLQTPPGPPNAYDEYPVLPPIGLQAPVPIQPPPPGPEVIPGPVARHRRPDRHRHQLEHLCPLRQGQDSEARRERDGCDR